AGEKQDYHLINTQKVVTISGEKTWKDHDNRSDIRPDQITVEVMNDKQQVAKQTVTADDDWSYIFDNLPKYDQQGKELQYNVKEELVEDYTTSSDGYDITNTSEKYDEVMDDSDDHQDSDHKNSTSNANNQNNNHPSDHGSKKNKNESN